MAQRRPITGHPAFAPFLAVWFAALFGLAVAVLPVALLERALTVAGLSALAPLTDSGRLIASGVAALGGAALGLAIAMPLVRRGRDPRPIYAEPETPTDVTVREKVIRRPLRVREELAEPGPAAWHEDDDRSALLESQTHSEAPDEGFMILTPQPTHPARPEPDIEALLEQFDNALAGARPSRRGPGPDPVHAFVARQTGTPAPSPLGGSMPDHQGELRAALDKLAESHRQD